MLIVLANHVVTLCPYMQLGCSSCVMHHEVWLRHLAQRRLGCIMGVLPLLLRPVQGCIVK